MFTSQPLSITPLRAMPKSVFAGSALVSCGRYSSSRCFMYIQPQAPA
jgi:hypothetical protein